LKEKIGLKQIRNQKFNSDENPILSFQKRRAMGLPPLFTEQTTKITFKNFAFIKKLINQIQQFQKIKIEL